MSAAIILAGGQATRLGPLASQLNKCLVTVGQQPMLVHQVRALQRAGVDYVTVVTSSASAGQVASVAYAAFSGLPIHIHVTVQTEGQSPVDALVDGLAWQLKHGIIGSTYVLDADTLIDHVPTAAGTWAHCVEYAGPDGGRAWCTRERNGTWTERSAFTDELIHTGLAHIESNVAAYRELAPKRMVGAAMLPAHAMTYLHAVPNLEDCNWQDVGDLRAIAAARRDRYIARSFNHLRLDDDGVVWKSGEVADEIEYYRRLPSCAERLFPRTFIKDGMNTTYGVEHIDQPTLAELWLYWPAPITTWVGILEDLCTRVDRSLWSQPAQLDPATCAKMYARQPKERLTHWRDHILYSTLVINGYQCVAGWDLLHALSPKIHALCKAAIPGMIHGDLNFNNILWSLTTGQPKLLDPRGSFGGQVGCTGDVHYDMAKLRYSYHGGFPAITHGLVNVEEFRPGEYMMQLGPERYTSANTPAATAQLDAVIGRYADIEKVKLVEVLLFLAGAPLHDPTESIPLYLRGVQLAQELL